MLNDMSALFDQFATMLKSVLPLSPFKNLISSIGELPGLGWLNWFFPVSTCLRIFAAWLVAYGVYLLYSIILRWIRAVK